MSHIRKILAGLVVAILLVPVSSAAAGDNDRLWCIVKTRDLQRCFDYHFPPPP